MRVDDRIDTKAMALYRAFQLVGEIIGAGPSYFIVVAVGGSLTFVHLLGIGLTGTSVNPARSFGPAIFLALAGVTVALEQVWVFIAAPFVGAIIAGLLYKYVFKTESA